VCVLAEFAEHADCHLAALGFTPWIDFDRLLAGTTLATPHGQSPFAFMRGKRFEASLRENGYGAMLNLLRQRMHFAVQDARVINLRDGYVLTHTHLKARAQETRRLIDAMLRDNPHAPNLIDGAVFETAIGGVTAYFEADAMAARSSGPIRSGEVKSFPIVDDRADPAGTGLSGAATDQPGR
jgi:hypothetical protein